MFVVNGFEWDEFNVFKNLIKHNVTIEEAEESFFTDPLILKIKEDIYYTYSITESGRYLFGVFLLKPERVIRIISIRDMDKKEIQLYKKKKGR